jgi:hypothetical protein
MIMPQNSIRFVSITIARDPGLEVMEQDFATSAAPAVMSVKPNTTAVKAMTERFWNRLTFP